MRKQDNDLSRRRMQRITARLMRDRRMLAGIAAILMGASLVFSGRVSAHNIDLAKAREVARDYARRVRDNSGGKYLHFSTSCVRSYPGHNHYVRCLLDYQNASDMKKGVYTCRETLDVYMLPHGGGISGVGSWDLHTMVVSKNVCGYP